MSPTTFAKDATEVENKITNAETKLKIILFNHSNENFIINNKDRVAQMVLTPIIKMELEETKELPETIRGEGGFGSTGR